MKTTFSRMFALIAAVILLWLVLLGVSFRVMLNSYLVDEKRETMYNSAQTLVNLAAAYDATGELEYRWGGFRLGMTSAAQVAGTEVLLIPVLRMHVESTSRCLTVMTGWMRSALREQLHF